MPFLKLGELIEISRVENTDSCIPSVSPEILDNFRKFAANLKKVAPKAEDFLYFSAVMMHAAEAAGLNDDGTVRLNARGQAVEVGWDKTGGTWRWMSNDPSVKPYKNSNGDIFPEEELVRAYKKWVGKPLCIDHKSSSVDHVRGFIVDTYYDRNLKRVIALCALDKAGYPQLARQVSTGVSTNVSMGTAVGKAICSDCARVARTEADFCDHMRRKSCYGEINVDLNPIELSIVVNGADPKASIKHIIAAANTLNSYVESKLAVAAKNFSATLVMNDLGTEPGVNNNGSTQFTVNSSDFNTFKTELDEAFLKLEEINASAKNSEKDTNDVAFNQSSGTVAMDETAVPNTDSGLAPPSVRYASAEVGANSIAELHKITASIEGRLREMKQNLDKLATSSTKTQEENMTGSKDISKKGYYQGTEEPTPGQAKYPKDPLNEQLREHEDKQMVGQAPFPEVGPVDGMHPSPASADPSGELERKKMLARAESEERSLRRAAIVNLAKQALDNKKAYFQGGGGVNEPTPGKTKYPADGLQYDLREDSDKHMTGQKPFPGVGSVDGLHPSPSSAETPDELKRKELLQRASLKARFVKAANPSGTQNLGKSAWEVYLGDKLLLTASVSELSGGRSEMLYDSIATKEFGTRLIEKVKAHGADKVRSLVKSGQDAAPPADVAPAPEAAPPAPEAAPVGAEDTGKDGDPKDSALDLAEKARDVTSDLVEAVRALTGEQAEMGDAAAPMGVAASDDAFSTANMNVFRKELNSELTHAMKEAIAALNDHQQELEMIASMYDKGAVTGANSELVGSIVDDALSEAKTAVADGFKLMTAFVKYARGTKAIVKRAAIEAELESLAEGDTMSTGLDSHSDSDLMSLINETNSDLDAVKDMVEADDLEPMVEEHEHEHNSLEGLEGLDGLMADDNDLMAKPDELKDLEVKPGTKVEVTASFDSREGRAALRAKLAADALGKEDDGSIHDMSKQKFSDMLDEANRLADGHTHLDTKPSGNLGVVETRPEVNKAMMELAKAPPKVRKEAEAIHKLISEGKLDPSDLDALVAEGLDKDAVSYYKKFYGQVDGGSEFASELVKEHVKAEMEKELNTFKLKMARAYELTYDMVDRGLVAADRQVISAHVDELMSFNEANFETLKKVVARHAPVMRKEAGRMPQVGMLGSSELNDVTSAVDDDWTQLSAAFSNTTKRLF
jgi:hypothetical protein